MYQTSTNITQKYCQETHYNYMGNSGFLVSDCFFLCSPLLCYCKAYRTNSFGNAITNSQGLLHAFVLSFRYHYTYRTNSCGNAIANSLGFSLFSAFVLSQSLPHKFLRKGLIKILVRENLTTS